MMKKILAVLLLSASTLSSTAQSPSVTQPEEMKRLDFLVGRWEGEGWIALGPGGRHTFRQTESVERKLGGAALLIEGVGRSKDPADSGAVVHNAFAVVSYDRKAGAYRWYALRAGGEPVDAQLKVSENTMIWGAPGSGGGEMRFTVRLNEKGQWFEVGEFSRDGKAWQKFFEMTLDRVK